MRYTLEDDALKQVKMIQIDGMVVVNPTTAQVDTNHAGYPLINTDQPEYDEDTQYLEHGYVQEADCIRETWTVTALSADEQKAKIEAEWEAFLATPVTYDVTGKQYLVTWAFDTYPATLQMMSELNLDSQAIGDVTGKTSGIVVMSRAEILALGLYLKGVWETQYAVKAVKLEALE